MIKQEGHDGPNIIPLTEPALEIIKGNILTKIHDDYVGK